MWGNRIAFLSLWVTLVLFYIYCRSYLPLMIMIITAVMTMASIAAAFVSSRKVTVSMSDSACNADPESRELEYCCVIKNDSFFPAPIITFFVKVRDMSESGFFARKIKTAIEGTAMRRIYVSLNAPYAAYCEGSVEKPRVYDAFGLVGFHAKVEGMAVRCLMLPNPRPEHGECDVPQTETEESDSYFENIRGDDRSQVFDIREYREGDDIRAIHWSVSTKHDALFVKEYSLPMTNKCSVLIESSLKSESANDTKKSADGVLGEFVSLASVLIKNEILFSVYICTENGELMEADVSMAEDVAEIMKMYLSVPLRSQTLCALNEMLDSRHTKKMIYYIYDSSAAGCKDIPALSEEFVLIDAAASEEAENVEEEN
ncbi:MAG: DUF58 domain-containing protein [Clostridia bacterium]|nr:DUF58 domain-containing protein [Clostridia bacterium]